MIDSVMNNLSELVSVKEDIKISIINKGGKISGGLTSYADAILGINAAKVPNGTKFAYSMFSESPLYDTSEVVDMSYMFNYCQKMWRMPLLDTSNVTNMDHMFYECNILISIPQLDTSNVTNMSDMFCHCINLQTIPLLDASNVTNMSGMFYNCQSLTSIPQLDTSNVTDMSYMFNGCDNLQTIPLLDTSNVTNMRQMFTWCPKLTSIPQLDTSNVTDMHCFYDNPILKDLGGFTGLKADIDLSGSPLLTVDSLLNVINYAAVVSDKVMYFGSENLNKLTDEQKMIAINKGWTLT